MSVFHHCDNAYEAHFDVLVDCDDMWYSVKFHAEDDHRSEFAWLGMKWCMCRIG